MFLMMEDKVRLYVKKSGFGIPCLFIHGGPGEGSLDFEALGGKGLETFMELIYFDQRGCARSGGADEDDYSLDRISQDIEEIRKALRIDKWIVMAHSFGGIIAANYTWKYENNVKGLILLNSTLNMEESFKSQIHYGAMLLPKEELKTKKFDSILKEWQYVVNKLIEKNLLYKLQYENYENYLKLSEVNGRIESFNGTMARQAFENKEYFSNFFSLTEKINTPVLIIAGAEDYAVGPEHYKSFNFPTKTVKLINGKHMLYLENWLQVRNSIEGFIQGLK